MHLFLVALAAIAFAGACTLPFDILRSRVEDLSAELHERATWRDIWSSIIPRGEYPKGAGYVRSSFQVGRSEPGSDEEAWQPIRPLSANNPPGSIANPPGTANITYNQVYVGAHEDQYRPAMFGLMGPLISQDELTMYWNSPQFWEKFFGAMEKRNMRSISNRLGNIFRQYSYKASANANFHFVTGDWATQPSPQFVDLSTVGVPQSELTQEMLDATAEELMQEGAQDGDTNGWITMGENGPEFPLYIGTTMSNRILLNNAELRSDFNTSFMGRGDINPVIKRIGAKRVIKNFRHIPNLFPARWAFVGNGATINFQTTGMDSQSGVLFATYNNTVGQGLKDANGVAIVGQAPTPNGNGIFVRIPTYTQSTASADTNVGSGQVPVVNGVWRDPAVAAYESAEVINPNVFTEEVLMPTNSLPGAKLNYQNYYGEWQFVTGNDAMLGINGCAGIQDPLKKNGRHFGEYRNAAHPIFPIFGRMILFKRCQNSFDTVTCS